MARDCWAPKGAKGQGKGYGYGGKGQWGKGVGEAAWENEDQGPENATGEISAVWMIAAVTRGPGVRVQNRFGELECSDDDDDEDEPPGLTSSEEEDEEELECKVCLEDEHAVM